MDYEEFKKEIENLILAHIDKDHFDIEFINKEVFGIYAHGRLLLEVTEGCDKYGKIIINLKFLIKPDHQINFTNERCNKYDWKDNYEKVRFIALHEARHAQQFLYELNKTKNVFKALDRMRDNESHYELDAYNYALYFLKDQNIKFDNLAV